MEPPVTSGPRKASFQLNINLPPHLPTTLSAALYVLNLALGYSNSMYVEASCGLNDLHLVDDFKRQGAPVGSDQKASQAPVTA